MRCRSGKHEWTYAVDADRCCDPAWSRQQRRYGEHDDLDPLGRRMVAAPWVIFGWVRVDGAAAADVGR